jgi:hypothetical protein
MEHLTCLLPGGYVDEGGVRHREVELTPLSGHEEELLVDRRFPGSAALVTVILSRCVRRLGSISPIPAELMRHLLVADRQYLLLRLRAITFGDQVQATVRCPWADCCMKVDIDFSLQDIPVKESQTQGPLYTMQLSPEAACQNEAGEAYRTVTFRLPNGEDQEVVAPLMADNAAKAFAVLLGRCIQSIGPWEQPGEALLRRLSPLAQQEIERQIEAVAPQLELTMEAQCPECGRDFTVPFDPQEFFFGELRTSRDLLYREVHYLAYHYHWSEQEIMAMPRHKRRRYIAVLADELEKLTYGALAGTDAKQRW